ncbi:uncharacterized protein PV07_06872 [Cladophialophora immunda]|uniref:Uncharacterized protein n=1 Tax=Cladophialophora immunda TaxID=569365 RepID=A0A0D2APS1_9EURO|nr:uncharacterized protein PV07_06872 [Cladophialophora immunda]KIW27097.1 hypothetical protein PV07_06872 [Cladophialophora immunda]
MCHQAREWDARLPKAVNGQAKGLGFGEWPMLVAGCELWQSSFLPPSSSPSLRACVLSSLLTFGATATSVFVQQFSLTSTQLASTQHPAPSAQQPKSIPSAW